jgi:hypothetical protein
MRRLSPSRSIRACRSWREALRLRALSPDRIHVGGEQDAAGSSSNFPTLYDRLYRTPADPFATNAWEIR